ncbi:MAG: hypothetical protein U0R64_09320 [Candidatus Nanopelagicales bacterium]
MLTAVTSKGLLVAALTATVAVFVFLLLTGTDLGASIVWAMIIGLLVAGALWLMSARGGRRRERRWIKCHRLG